MASKTSKFDSAVKIARASFTGRERLGLRPVVAWNWVSPNTTEALRAEDIAEYGVGFIRRALREEAVRATDPKVQAAFYFLREDVKNHAAVSVAA